jgi:hypothetical protein
VFAVSQRRPNDLIAGPSFLPPKTPMTPLKDAEFVDATPTVAGAAGP